MTGTSHDDPNATLQGKQASRSARRAHAGGLLPLQTAPRPRTRSGRHIALRYKSSYKIRPACAAVARSGMVDLGRAIMGVLASGPAVVPVACKQGLRCGAGHYAALGAGGWLKAAMKPCRQLG